MNKRKGLEKPVFFCKIYGMKMDRLFLIGFISLVIVIIISYIKESVFLSAVCCSIIVLILQFVM